MFALAIESSHSRGMGHLFRCINLCKYLKIQNENVIIIINDNKVACEILRKGNIQYEVVDYADISSDWETKLIEKYGISVWINDKYTTRREMYEHIRRNSNVILAAIDEEGGHDDLLQLHFVGMVFQSGFIPKGERVYQGIDYIILNQEIRKYRRTRERLSRVLVTLGGSDTYGVTVRVVEILKKMSMKADIIIGPSFEHYEELGSVLTEDYHIYQNVPSMIATMNKYDLAITGGGVTCLEAIASGLPAIVVANELFEIDTAKCFERLGCCIFAGFYKEIDENAFCIEQEKIYQMSRLGLELFSLNAEKTIYDRILEYREERYGK